MSSRRKPQKSAAASAVAGVVSRLNNWKILLGVAAGLISGGAVAQAYMGQFAKKETVVPLQEHIAQDRQQIGFILDQLADVKKSQDWQRDQLFEIAKTVRAPLIPAKK